LKIEIHNIDGINIAEVISDKVEINNTQDALDLMANCNYQGASRIIIHKKNIIEDFFNLGSRIAGDILQKFSNYNNRLAIIGNFKVYTSKSLKDFIFESNRIGRINFVDTIDEAKERLARK
jgi:hypothetical protein